MIRLRLVASVVAVVSLAASAARAEPPAPAPAPRPVRFALTSPGGAAPGPLDACGGTSALEAAVEARLHRAVFAEAATADILVELVTEAQAPPMWSAHIVEHDRAGRELGRRDVAIKADDCAKGVETLAVVMAIMVGPERTTTEAPAERPTSPAPATRAPPATPPIVGRPPPTPEAPPHPHWTASATAELVLGTGILPGLSWGLQAGVFVRPPASRLSLAARASYWPPRDTGPAGSTAIDRLGGGLVACFDLIRAQRKATVAICSGAEAARLHSTSSVLTRASESGAVLDVLAEARLGYRFDVRGPFLIEPVLAAQAAAVLRGDRFRYRDVGGTERTLLDPSPVAFQASLGVVVHFL